MLCKLCELWSKSMVVVINPAATELDAVAHLCLRARAAQCLPPLLAG